MCVLCSVRPVNAYKGDKSCFELQNLEFILDIQYTCPFKIFIPVILTFRIFNFIPSHCVQPGKCQIEEDKDIILLKLLEALILNSRGILCSAGARNYMFAKKTKRHGKVF